MAQDIPQPFGIIERYRDRLPIKPDTVAITLGEGNTPLIPLRNLSKKIQSEWGKEIQLFAKFEGLNPTGSFKDRGMTMAITNAVENGAKSVICASTGNTSAAAAAYAARANLQCVVLIPDGKIALGKLAQAMMHGAIVVQIDGNFDDGMQLVKEAAEKLPVALVNSVNPYRLQGQKTIAFEIVESLGDAPDYHCLPVGNAGNITAHWMGYCEQSPELTKDDVTPYLLTNACGFCRGECKYTHQRSPSIIKKRPVMLGYQAAGAAPFMAGGPVNNPDTVATAIRIGNPQSWEFALAASKESGGWFDAFSDEQILATQKRLATEEGVFCEPASAVSVAGALRDIENGKIANGSSVVCTLTGHGLKDPDIAIKQNAGSLIKVPPKIAEIEKIFAEIG